MFRDRTTLITAAQTVASPVAAFVVLKVAFRILSSNSNNSSNGDSSGDDDIHKTEKSKNQQQLLALRMPALKLFFDRVFIRQNRLAPEPFHIAIVMMLLSALRAIVSLFGGRWLYRRLANSNLLRNLQTAMIMMSSSSPSMSAPLPLHHVVPMALTAVVVFLVGSILQLAIARAKTHLLASVESSFKSTAMKLLVKRRFSNPYGKGISTNHHHHRLSPLAASILLHDSIMAFGKACILAVEACGWFCGTMMCSPVLTQTIVAVPSVFDWVMLESFFNRDAKALVGSPSVMGVQALRLVGFTEFVNTVPLYRGAVTRPYRQNFVGTSPFASSKVSRWAPLVAEAMRQSRVLNSPSVTNEERETFALHILKKSGLVEVDEATLVAAAQAAAAKNARRQQRASRRANTMLGSSASSSDENAATTSSSRNADASSAAAAAAAVAAQQQLLQNLNNAGIGSALNFVLFGAEQTSSSALLSHLRSSSFSSSSSPLVPPAAQANPHHHSSASSNNASASSSRKSSASFFSPDALNKTWSLFAANGVVAADSIIGSTAATTASMMGDHLHDGSGLLHPSSSSSSSSAMLQWTSMLQASYSLYSCAAEVFKAAEKLGPMLLQEPERSDESSVGYATLLAQGTKLVGKVVIQGTTMATSMSCSSTPISREGSSADLLSSSLNGQQMMTRATSSIAEINNNSATSSPVNATGAEDEGGIVGSLPFHLYPGAGLLVAAQTDAIADVFVSSMLATIPRALNVEDDDDDNNSNITKQSNNNSSCAVVEVVSSDPLIIPGMSFADQITFPRKFRDLETVGEWQLYQLLESVGLQGLIEDDNDTWHLPVCSAAANEQVSKSCDIKLSLAQRQQLAIARVLYRKPRYVLLSHVLFPADDQTMQPNVALLKKCIGALKAAGISVVSVVPCSALKDWTVRCSVAACHFSGLYLASSSSSTSAATTNNGDGDSSSNGDQPADDEREDDDDDDDDDDDESRRSSATKKSGGECSAAFGIIQNPPPSDAAPIALLSQQQGRSSRTASVGPETFLVFSRVIAKSIV